jgi:hypothetical protein
MRIPSASSFAAIFNLCDCHPQQFKLDEREVLRYLGLS